MRHVTIMFDPLSDDMYEAAGVAEFLGLEDDDAESMVLEDPLNTRCV